MNNILWFNEISDSDLSIVGKKALNISKIFRNNLPAPNGFCITSDFFNKFQEETKIKERINELLSKLNLNDLNSLYGVSDKIQEIIANTNMPNILKYEIINAYENISVNIDVYKMASKQALEIIKAGRDTAIVALRPSLINETINHQPNILNIKGKEDVVKAVQKCWSFMFSPNSLNLKLKNKVPLDYCGISVIVQKMIDSEKSGVIYTYNLENKNKNELVIEACLGQGEVISSGVVIPDKYVVDRDSFVIKDKLVSLQDFMLIKDENIGRNIKKSLFYNEQKLNDDEIKKISSFALEIERLYAGPQEIEFCLNKDKMFVLQSKSLVIPWLNLKEEHLDEFEEKLKRGEQNILVKGINASLGVRNGYVNIINEEKDINNIRENQILVLKSGDLVNLNLIEMDELRRVSGIVTDNDTIDSPLAKLSREFGIPCIVSAADSTRILRQEQFVTIDANTGIVYEEKTLDRKPEKVIDYLDTATGIKVLIDDANKLIPDSDKNEGIGLLKINLDYENYDKDFLIEKIADELNLRIENFKDKPVWYYVEYSFDKLDLLNVQFESLRKLQDKGVTNIGVAVGNLTEVSSLKKVKDIFREINLEPLEEIEFGVIVDSPASSILIKEICEDGVDFVVIDLERLTKMTLGFGIDCYNEYHPAVLRQISNIVKMCRRLNIEISIVGKQINEPEFIEFLIKNGIDSVICNVDNISEMRSRVAKSEKKLILKAVRDEYHSKQL